MMQEKRVPDSSQTALIVLWSTYRNRGQALSRLSDSVMRGAPGIEGLIPAERVTDALPSQRSTHEEGHPRQLFVLKITG
jgi:hypothetical protein